jgi:Zn finger protein HypA/HybF involved in hydrogenase expression
MSTLAPVSITHWCRNCNTHHAVQQVRRGVSSKTSYNTEEDVLICPSCNGYDIEELLEVQDAE